MKLGIHAGSLALMALAAACQRAPDDGAAPAPADTAAGAERALVREVRLVDSLLWSNELAEGTRYRVAVVTGAGVDTLDVATLHEPVVAGDTLVHGFIVESDGSIPAGFVYDPASRDLRRVDLPPDFLGFTAFALSPDARHLAYAGRAADGSRLAALVRRWPGGELVHGSDPVSGYPSDATNSEAVWNGPDDVEIRIRLNVLDTPGGEWLRVRGAPGGAMRADTVRGSASE